MVNDTEVYLKVITETYWTASAVKIVAGDRPDPMVYPLIQFKKLFRPRRELGLGHTYDDIDMAYECHVWTRSKDDKEEFCNEIDRIFELRAVTIPTPTPTNPYDHIRIKTDYDLEEDEQPRVYHTIYEIELHEERRLIP